MPLPILTELCRDLGWPLDSDQEAKFEEFRDALYRINESRNLTRVPQEESEIKHFCDSVLTLDMIPHGASVADLGSGPGLPAWPLACARPDLKVVAVDGSERMFDAMRQVPLPNLEVRQARAEDWGVRNEFDVVVGRALAPLAIQLELSAPAVKIGGFVIPYRTPSEREEAEKLNIGQLGLRLDDVVVRALPGGMGERLFPIYIKFRESDPQYPRPWAKMKTKPLGIVKVR